MTERPGTTETAYGAEVEVSALTPIPHLPIGARVALRFERRIINGVTDIADEARVTPEAVVDRLDSDTDPYADLLEQTLRAIETKASAEHRAAMARVAAQAWSGDDATIDRAVVVVDAIASLQPVHVRVLVGAARLNETAGIWPIALEGPVARQVPVTVDRVADDAAIDFETVRGLLGQLVARGLLWVDAVTTFNYRTDDYVVTELGSDVLAALAR